VTKVEGIQLTAIEVETRTKKGGKKDKKYSIKCVQNVCKIEYKGKIKDRKLLKFVPLIGTFGETAVQITGRLSVIVGFFGVLLFDEYRPDIGLIPTSVIMLCFIALLHYGIKLLSYSKYVKASRCKSCHRNYAYKETEHPDIREISTENSYNVLITRYWKCKHCGFIDRTESSENIWTRKGKKREPKKITCGNCGKTKITSEFKDPDKKFNEYRAIRIRYYRCEYCGHINIIAENGYEGEYCTSWIRKENGPGF